jgi:plastocyanin
MKLLQERCDDREIVGSRPLYGLDDNIVYKVRPVLHEPGPINTSWLKTKQGIPVHKGEPIRVSGEYDGDRPHVRVMSVMHIYMARAKSVPAGCAPLPSDATNENIKVPGRFEAPVVDIPLTGLDENGRAVEIDRPPGPTQSFDGNVSVRVKDYAYSKVNMSIPLGASITWKFPDPIAHDVSMASGPLGFSSPYSRLGRTYTQKFTRAGSYRLFCSLHPVLMHETVEVRDGQSSAKGKPTSVGGAPAGPTIHW